MSKWNRRSAKVMQANHASTYFSLAFSNLFSLTCSLLTKIRHFSFSRSGLWKWRVCSIRKPYPLRFPWRYPHQVLLWIQMFLKRLVLFELFVSEKPLPLRLFQWWAGWGRGRGERWWMEGGDVFTQTKLNMPWGCRYGFRCAVIPFK